MASSSRMYLQDFYLRTFELGLDYARLLLRTGDGLGDMMANTFDCDGITLLHDEGDEAGNITIPGMKYWRVTSVRRRISRGNTRALSIILGIT